MISLLPRHALVATLTGACATLSCGLVAGYRDDYVRVDGGGRDSGTETAGDGGTEIGDDGGDGATDCGGACCPENRPAKLEPGSVYVGGLNHWRVTAGPFDVDGNVDVVATYGSSESFVFRGTGTGELVAGPRVAAGTGTIQAVMVDMSSDGIPDAVFAAYASHIVTVAIAQGDGTVRKTVVTSARCGTASTPRPVSLVARDFDGDGKADLALANLEEGVCILHGIGDGRFERPLLIEVPGRPKTIGSIDMDGDGRADVVASMEAGGAVLVRNSGKDFDPLQFVAGGTETQNIATGDLDEDGRGDFVLSHELGAEITVHLAASGFVAVAYKTSPYPATVGIADINGDCHGDVLLTYSTGFGSTDNLDILRGTGKGNLLPIDSYPFGDRAAFALADFDNDGFQDIVLSRTSGGPGQGAVQLVLNRTYR